MAEKDIVEKALEAHNDVFADIINGLLFGGKKVVSEADLETEAPRSVYKADGKLHEQERDTAKYWKHGKIRVTMYGMENETKPEPDMPIRVIGYDGAGYRAQLLRDTGSRKKRRSDPGPEKPGSTDDKLFHDPLPENSKEKKKKSSGRKKHYPVITLVLYFGYNTRWNTPRTLRECLEIPEELEPYVNDYKINLFEIAYLTDEQVQKFHSDFRLIADYFVQMRRGQEYKAPPGTIRHVHEFLQFMTAMTGDSRFEEFYEPEKEKEEVTMRSIVIDQAMEKGMEKGRAEGIEKGRAEGMRKGMRKGMRRGIEKGSVNTLASLVRSHTITLEQAAANMSLSTEDFTAKCKHYNLSL